MRQRITLETIQQDHEGKTYPQLYGWVLEQIGSGALKPIKASGTNGKKPALHQEYWAGNSHEKKDYQALLEELSFRLSPAISIDYYLSHLDVYEQDRKWVCLLDVFLKASGERLDTSASINERSFEIWHREKFLSKGQGRKILNRCGIDLRALNLYETTEPLACYVDSRKTPQNILIIENKDTFYSMRRHLLYGKARILGTKIGTLIYGAGKSILRSFQDFTFCVEPYMRDKGNAIYYFGDLDYEGIGIYERLAALFRDYIEIMPFCPAYEAMLSKAESICDLPETKVKQNRNITSCFFSYFNEEKAAQMREILKSDLYIPQEILDIGEL